jgi:Leucine-rich repeat (LRR) protein
MRITGLLKKIIVEQSRFEVLLDKYTKAKKNKETGKESKPTMDVTRLGQIILADPTTVKPQNFDESDLSLENLQKLHPGGYTNWLLKNYKNPKLGEDAQTVDPTSPTYAKMVARARDVFMEDLFKVTDDLKKFTRYKQYFDVDKRDINKFTPDSLFSFLDSFVLPEKKQKELDKKELKKEIRKEREGFKHPGASIDFVGDKWTVARIDKEFGEKAREAASWYGGYYDYDAGESRWCTSPPNASYTMGYLKDGPLYVILSNDESGPVGKRTGLPQLRYQWHFPSNQFMDRADRGINLVEFLNGPGEELKEYFKPQFAKGLVDTATNKLQINYPNSAVGKYIALYGFEDLFDTVPSNLSAITIENTSNENISLNLPPAIGRFKDLRALLLRKIVSSIPKEIGELKNLQFLSLPDNPNLKTLPKEIGTLPNLQFITLRGTNLTEIPKEITEKFTDQGNGMWILE